MRRLTRAAGLIRPAREGLCRRSGWAVLALALGLTVLPAGEAGAEPTGWVDRSYGSGGAAGVGEEKFVPFQTWMTTDSQGRTVLAHHPSQDLPMFLSRLTPGGALDMGFGAAGRVRITDLLGANDVEGLATGPADTTLAFHDTFGTYLARVNAAGAPDATFGAAGSAHLQPSPCAPLGGFHQSGIAVSPTGAVLLWCPSDTFSSAVTVLTPAGRRDSRFNPAGATPGTLVLTGSRVDAAVFTSDRILLSVDRGLGRRQVVSLTTAGARDPAFGVAGVVDTPTSNGSLAVDGSGVLVSGQRITAAGVGATQTITRLRADGTPDPAFGTAGVARLPQITCAGAPFLQVAPQGIYVTVASCGVATVVARLTRSGRPDRAFGSGGQFVLSGVQPFASGGEVVGTGLSPAGALLLGLWGSDGARPQTWVTRLRGQADLTAGAFTGMPGTALLDTARGIGGPAGALAPGGAITVQVQGRAQLPATGVGAVLLTVRADAATGTGGLLMGPAGAAAPTVPALPIANGRTTVNQAVVPLGAGGAVTLTNRSTGTVQLSASVAGWYRAGTPTAAGAFVAVTPSRALDTTTGAGATGPVAPGSGVTVPLTGRAGLPASGVSAVVVDLGASGTGTGPVSAFAAGTTEPGTAALWATGRPTASLATIAVGTQGAIRVVNRAGAPLQLTADVVGYYRAGTPTRPGTYVPMSPVRIADTRTDPTFAGPPAPLGSQESRTLLLTPTLPPSAVATVLGTTLLTRGSSTGTMSFTGSGQFQAATVIPYSAARDTAAPFAVSPAAGFGGATNNSTGTVDLVVDLVGWFRT